MRLAVRLSRPQDTDGDRETARRFLACPWRRRSRARNLGERQEYIDLEGLQPSLQVELPCAIQIIKHIKMIKDEGLRRD